MQREALAELYEAKAGSYARFQTGLVARHAERLLPPGGRVLDIGCASGGLLEILRPVAGHLAGLELSASAAREAARIGDDVVQGSVDDPELPFEADSFDLVVLADVLEHLVDPTAAIERAVGWCRPGGWIVASTPNIAHWRARLELLRGRWPREETGTFDAGHLRFFTQESFHALLRRAGLERVAIEPVVQRLGNHLPLERVATRRPVRRLEAAWQRVGRRVPGLLGYQLVAHGQRDRSEECAGRGSGQPPSQVLS